MSTIDERVVSMKFNNTQFQKGIGETQQSLEDLKKKLNFDGAKKGFDDLNNAAKNVKIDSMGAGVDEVKSKFSALQVVALGVFATIGSKAVDLGINLAKNLVDNVTSAMREGFSDYNLKLTSVQTVMNATGMDIDEVNGFFNQLDEYADKTVYNLQDMTSAYAKFVNAGIDSKKAIPAIKGIANMTALAGQGAGEAQIAMYNLSQSLAGGFLTTTDYKSLNLANVATKEWKDQMISAAKAAGTLKKGNDGLYHIPGSKKAYSDSQLFTEALSEQWATSDVLLDVLGDYGDELTDIGKKALGAAQNVKSIPMMLETLSAAVGTGWTTSFELVLGNVEESTKLFTELTNRIQAYTDASSDARNEQLQIWKDMGGREAVIEGIWNLFDAFGKILTPIKEAWQEVFPPSLGKTLANLSFLFRDLTKGLIISDEASANLKMIAKVLFGVLKAGFDIVGGLFKILWNGVTIIWDLVSAFFGLIEPVITFVRSLLPIEEGADGAMLSVTGIVDKLIEFQDFLTGPIIGFIKDLGGNLNNFLNSGELQARVGGTIDLLKDLAGVAETVYNVLFKGEFTGNAWFEEDSPFVDALFKIRDIFLDLKENASNFASNIIPTIKKVFDAIRNGFIEGFSNIDWAVVLSALNTGLLGVVVFTVIKAIRDISSMFKGANLLGGIGEALDGLTGVLSGMQKKLKAEALKNIAAAIVILALGLLVLSLIDPDRLISASAGLATAVGILVGATFALSKISGSPKDIAKVVVLGAAMIQLATAMTILSFAVERLGKLDVWELARGLGAIVVLLGALVGAIALLPEKDLLKSAAAILIMSAAITALAGAVAIFGMMPIEVLLQGGLAVVAILGLLTGAAILLSKYAKEMLLSAVGLMAMAAAINMLIVPVTTLGLIPYPVLLQGLGMLALIIGGLVAAAGVLNKVAPQMVMSAVGLMAMAAAINLLIGPLTILGFLPFGNMIQGIIGLAGVMAVLVIAAKALEKAVVGTVGMLAMSAAMLVLSVALKVLSTIPMETLWVLVGVIGALLAVFGIAAAILGPVIPVLYAISGAFALFSVALLLMAGSLVVFAIGVSLLGPAIMSLTGGLLVFAKASGEIAGAAGPMALIGAAMIVLGAGALVAGVGLAALGVGLLILGAGFALVGTTALLGATALAAAFSIMVKLVEQAGPMALLGASLIVLGVGMVAFGAGLVLVSVGAVAFAVALAILAVSGLAAIPVLTALAALIPVFLTALAEGVIAFTETIRAAIPTFVATAVEMINGFLEGVQEVVPNVIDTVVVMLTALLQAIIDTIPMIINTAVALIQGFLAGVRKVSPDIIKTMLQLLKDILKGIVDAVPMIVTAGMQLITGLLRGIEKKLPGLLDAAGDLIAKFIEGLGEQALKIAKAGGDTIVKFLNGLTDYVKNNTSRFTSAGSKLFRAVVDGISSAIRTGAGDLRYAGEQISQALWDGAMAFLNINSPSKKFRDEMMPQVFEGITAGTKKGIKNATASGEYMGSAVFEGVKKSLSQISNSVMIDPNMTPTIRPILDLTDVRKEAKTLKNIWTTPTLSVGRMTDYAIDTANAVQSAKYQKDQLEYEKYSDIAGDRVTFIQNNNSPKALSNAELYRQTRNQIASAKNLKNIKNGGGVK